MNFSMTETPGGVYAFAYWLAVLVYIGVNKKRIKGAALFVIGTMFLILVFSYMTLNSDVPTIYFVPSMTLTVLILFLFIYWCCDLPILNLIYFTIRAFILGEFMGSLGWQILFYITKDLELNLSLYIGVLLLVIIDLAVATFIFLLERRYIHENRQLEISKREVISAFIIGVVVFTLSNISYVNYNTPFSGKVASDIFNVRTLVDFGGVALLFAFHMQIAELKMKFEVEKLQNLLNMQKANYEMSQKSIDMLNQKYHDLKHQIAILKSGSKSTESLNYLNIMEKEIKSYEAQNKTGNKVLDTVLMGKQILCQSKGIDLTCIANGGALDFIDPIDISTLFGNALDNAIEGVSKITENDKKLIHMSVSKTKGFLRIKIENCYQGDLFYKNGIPVTTKNDKYNHGYGIKSILSIVKKYNGSVTIEDKNSWFEVRILIPII